MKELEKLLHSLIGEGWNPWGIEWDDIEFFNLDIKRKNIHIWYMNYDEPGQEEYEQDFKSFRELVSLESGLWQFVVENKLFNKNLDIRTRAGDDLQYDIYDHQCRLIESALISEEELGKFLLDNITI